MALVRPFLGAFSAAICSCQAFLGPFHVLPKPLALSEGCELLHFLSTRKVPEEGNGANVAALLTSEQSQPSPGSHCHPFLLLDVTSTVCIVPMSGT